jgi:hypothetical protein
MSCSNINQKGMHVYKTFLEMTYFHLEPQNPIKKSNNVFFCTMSPILLSKPLEHNL